MKWNPEGDVIWSTFLGGSGSDVLYSVAIDKNDDIIVAGRTESNDIIVSDDASQKDYKGASDFYLAKFTTDGEYVWSTYWGGNRAEIQCRMVLDETGNIYLGGTTSSTGKNTLENIILPTNEDAIYTEVGKPSTDEETYYTTYISKFTQDGKYIWGTYFGNRGDVSEVLTGLDVFEDEVAFSWDLWGYRATKDGNHIFAIVTEDAEQKEGITIEGQWNNTGWQTQVFKIDTAGTTLKYGTFYSGDNNLSYKVKYDIDRNLILNVGALREKPRKDSVFKSTGHLVFVKYNRNNELEWDFGFGCFDDSLIDYDFDIDENNVLWTAGRTSCKNIEKGKNPFTTDRDTSGGPTGFIFILDLHYFKHWYSYYDLGGRDNNDISVKNNILNTSGATGSLRTKPGGLFNNRTTIGFFISIDLNDVINYINPTDSIDPIDTLDPNNDIIFFPNPVNDIIYLGKIDSINSIKILDLVGKEFLNITDIKNKEINVSNLSIGVYFLIINEKKVFKFIKR